MRMEADYRRNGLTAAEVDHLITLEWARTADDVLWRRTKLGLHLPLRFPMDELHDGANSSQPAFDSQ